MAAVFGLTGRPVWDMTPHTPSRPSSVVCTPESEVWPLPTPVLRLAALLLGLNGPPDTPAELPVAGEVTTDSLASYVEPDAASVVTEKLPKGAKLWVVDVDPVSGWLTVDPPDSAFGWVERSAVRKEPNGIGRVVARPTVVRAGIAGAKMPGPPRSVLDRGSVVRFLDRPEMTLGAGRDRTTWVAVGPLKGEVRYVRAEGVVLRRPEIPEPSGVTRASFEETRPGADGSLPPEVAAEIASIEAQHRAAIQEPMDRWQLGAVRARYESLLKRVGDASGAETVRGRLDLVARHEEIARSARAFQTLLARSRRRDQEVAMTVHRLAELEHPRRRPFDAEGLVQASSRLVEGRRVFALIGPEGDPVAYLDVPPGLDARAAMTKRVGVRGSVRYNETLGARLIAVRDLEPLE